MRRLVSTLAVSLAFGAPAFVLAGPAWAQGPAKQDPQVVLTGRVVIAEGESVDDVVIFNGPASVDGEVNGVLIVFNGDLDLSGQVTGDVVVFNGNASITETATIGGDLVTRHAPDVAPGATIEGRTRRVEPREWATPFTVLTKLAVWLAVSVSALILGLLFLLIGPRAADATYDAARTRTGPSIGWGFLLFFGLPIAAVLALVTLVGIPFGIALLLALALIYSIGYVISAWVLGRTVLRTAGRVLAFLVGLLILRLIALVPVLGGITWFLGAVFGLGVLIVAAWRARVRAGMEAPAAPA